MTSTSTAGYDVINPQDDRYDAARAVWNGVVDHRPLAIARPRNAGQVAEALLRAREAGGPVAVRGGGHSMQGHSMADGGVTIDLSAMNTVAVDAPARRARVGGGALLADVADAAGPHGLAIPYGHVSHTGVAGLTQFEFELCDHGPLALAGMVLHPLDRAGDALRFSREFMDAAPDDVSIRIGRVLLERPLVALPGRLPVAAAEGGGRLTQALVARRRGLHPAMIPGPLAGALPSPLYDGCMLGGGSIQLARVLGIRIGVDPSWFIVLFLIIWSLSGSYEEVLPGDGNSAFMLAVVSALLFFLSIVLHELGHAVVAMRNDIGIAGIDLWLFGGIAKMRREADSAGVEFRIAAAGPAVTLLIVALCFGVGVLASGVGGFIDAVGLNPDNGFEAVLGFVAYVNAALLLFNLIPGFPLDGGRIARAIVWWRTGDRVRATRFAARLGRGFAYLLMGLGVFWLLQGVLLAGVWMIFIGVFINQAARSAEMQTRITSRIEGLRVGDVMDAEPVALSLETKLDLALDEYFLRYGWPWFPVTDFDGRFVGYVTREALEGVPEEMRPGSSVDEVMSRDGGSVNVEEPLEALLGSESLQRLGAIMAVDGDGVLRGVVTLDQVRRALRPAV